MSNRPVDLNDAQRITLNSHRPEFLDTLAVYDPQHKGLGEQLAFYGEIPENARASGVCSANDECGVRIDPLRPLCYDCDGR
jgi:hypothetical protein